MEHLNWSLTGVNDQGRAGGNFPATLSGDVDDHQGTVRCVAVWPEQQAFDEETPVQIELARIVAAHPRAVFATVADVETWPRILRSVKSVELLTPGSLRVGTRLREQRVMFGRETTEEMEVIEIERTRRLRL